MQGVFYKHFPNLSSAGARKLFVFNSFHTLRLKFKLLFQANLGSVYCVKNLVLNVQNYKQICLHGPAFLRLTTFI